MDKIDWLGILIIAGIGLVQSTGVLLRRFRPKRYSTRGLIASPPKVINAHWIGEPIQDHRVDAPPPEKKEDDD